MLCMRTLPAGFIEPCLPTKADTLPSGGLWIHEIKHDEFRIIACKNGAQVRLYSRPKSCGSRLGGCDSKNHTHGDERRPQLDFMTVTPLNEPPHPPAAIALTGFPSINPLECIFGQGSQGRYSSSTDNVKHSDCAPCEFRAAVIASLLARCLHRRADP